jgi:hypothetical protein
MSAQDPISTYHSTLEKLARQRFGARAARGPLHRLRAKLPRGVRRDLALLDDQMALAAHPKLRRRLDPQLARGAYARGRSFIAAHGRGGRLRQALRDGFWGSVLNLAVLLGGLALIYLGLIA